MLVAGVTAVRVSSVQLRVADGQVGVAVGILGVPRLTLAARLGHADGAPVLCPAAVVTLVVWRRRRWDCASGGWCVFKGVDDGYTPR